MSGSGATQASRSLGSASVRAASAVDRGTDIGRDRARRNPNFITLWLIVSCLWTVATVLRMWRTWGGWPEVLSSPMSWVSVLLPPLIFALVLFAMSRIADPQHRR